jgi:hypothetical protein
MQITATFSLTANTIKFIATIVMLIDHIDFSLISYEPPITYTGFSSKNFVV